MKREQKSFCISVCMLIAFVLWTVLIRFIDVKPIGPQKSTVGFATFNAFIHNLTGVNISLYVITDWLGLVPLGFALGFALLGLIQWIKRGHLKKVDFNILVLGGFYIVTMSAYIFFETVVINYRPILINGYLEASYPSSTTVLVMCVMPTTIMQVKNRIKNKLLRQFINFAIEFFIAFMIIGRLISGVHWITDIIGGAILSTGLVMMYRYFIGLEKTA